MKKKLLLLLTLAALVAGQSSAWAQSTFTIETPNSANDKVTFKVRRNNTSKEETVRYRTVGLSGIVNQHFGDAAGTLTFAKGDSEELVEVIINRSRRTFDMGLAYEYQMPNTPRTFRLEVRDMAERNILASKVYGISYPDSYSLNTQYLNREVTDLVKYDANYNFASGMPNGKYYDWHDTDGELTVTDEKPYYGKHRRTTIKATGPLFLDDNDSYYLNREYFEFQMGGRIYATVCYSQKEAYDGYQYIQLCASEEYDSTDDPNKDVANLVNAIYKACFELSGSTSALKTYHHQFFPRRYGAYNRDLERIIFDKLESYSGERPSSEFSVDDGLLWKQAFKDDSYNAPSSGAVILPAETEYFYVRFDAGGDDKDTWYVKDLFVRFALGDVQAPLLIDKMRVSRGYQYRGTPTNISVPFSEIVKVTGTPTLTTTWGTFTYEAGDGTNVLSFTGTIDAVPGTTLSINRINVDDTNTIKDVVGNPFVWQSGTVASVQVISVASSGDGIVDDFLVDSQGRGTIASQADLKKLADYVQNGGNTLGQSFVQTADIDLTGDYRTICIGNATHPFQGTYDGDGHFLGYLENSAGLFGVIDDNSTVKGVVLQQSTITGSGEAGTGGIVGKNAGGIIEDCYVKETVTVRAGSTGTRYIGGIVGYNSGTVEGCLSKANVYNNQSGCQSFGGIAGFSSGSITKCLYMGDNVSSSASHVGAILGERSGGSLDYNYYVSVNSSLPGGCDGTDLWSGHADRAYTITLGADMGFKSPQSPYPASGITPFNLGEVLGVGNTCYSSRGLSVNVSYSGTVATGYQPVLCYAGGDNEAHQMELKYGYYVFAMPPQNVTVSAASAVLIHYTITYDSGVSHPWQYSESNPETYTYEDDDITLAPPTRPGYTFVGWFLDKNCTQPASSPQIPAHSTGNKKFWAKWTEDDGQTITIEEDCKFRLLGEEKYVTTFYNRSLDYQLPSGALAYTVEQDGARMVFHRIGENSDIIPSGNAVVIVSDQREIALTKVPASAVSIHEGNILQGSYRSISVTEGMIGGNAVYVLGVSGGVLGFYKYTGETIPAGKAHTYQSLLNQ